MQNREASREDVARKLSEITHVLKCIADEATGATRAEIDVARRILIRVTHETKEACQRETSSQIEVTEIGPSFSQIGAESTRTDTRRFPIRDFSNVEVDCAFSFEIGASEEFSVEVSAPQGLFDHVNVSKSGNTLKLSHRPVRSVAAPVLAARITMPTLCKLRQGAASKGRVAGFRSQEPFDLFVSGASTAELDMAVGDVRMEISGSSRVTGNLEANSADLVLSGAAGGNLRGKASSLTLSAWGAADIDLTDLAVEDATVYLKGASQAVINTSGNLSVELTGASRLDYVGHPSVKEINLSGASALGEVTGPPSV